MIRHIPEDIDTTHMKKFRLYWLDGKTEVIEGNHSVNQLEEICE
jgi:hypothetical protein